MEKREHDGMVDLPSQHSVDEIVARLLGLLRDKAITLFAVIDHSGEAAKVGMTMRPTKLLIFGSPKAGTPLMLASPSVAIDLPLKLLIWQDDAGKVWISFSTSQYLRERHHFPPALEQNIAAVAKLAEAAASGPV